MLATKSRVWVAGTLVLCLLLVVASWFLLIDPKRAEAAQLEQQAADVQASNTALEARIAQLKLQFAELPTYQAELAAIRQAMPEEAALPTLVRDLDAMATASGVTLMTVTPGAPVAVPTTVVAPVADPAAAADTEAAPAAEGEAAAGAAPVTPVAPAPTDVLVSIPTSVVVVGDFFQAELFLKKLQAEMPRAFLVQTLGSVAEVEGEAAGGKPATKNGDVTMTITGSVFVLKSAAAAAAVTPVDPAAATTVTAP